MILVVVACAIMSFIDGVVRPDYAVKSLVKAILFMFLPFLFFKFHKGVQFSSILKPKRKGILQAVLLGIFVYLFIVFGYLVLSNFVDFSQITPSLNKNIGVEKDNFVFVALYISFVNSFLEELFFRGFAFITLKKYKSRLLAFTFSSFMFAFYHLAMIIGWFDVVMYLLVFVGLVLAGIIFNALDEKYENIYNSWMVHMFANFGINTVGFILFGII